MPDPLSNLESQLAADAPAWAAAARTRIGRISSDAWQDLDHEPQIAKPAAVAYRGGSPLPRWAALAAMITLTTAVGTMWITGGQLQQAELPPTIATNPDLPVIQDVRPRRRVVLAGLGLTSGIATPALGPAENPLVQEWRAIVANARSFADSVLGDYCCGS